MNTVSYSIETGTEGPGVARLSVKGSFGFPELMGQVVSFDLNNTLAACYVQEVNLISGNNAIQKPAAAGAVVIIPPVDNAYTMILKGSNGDVGISLSLTAPSLMTLHPVTTSFVITTSGAMTGVKFVWF